MAHNIGLVLFLEVAVLTSCGIFTEAYNVDLKSIKPNAAEAKGTNVRNLAHSFVQNAQQSAYAGSQQGGLPSSVHISVQGSSPGSGIPTIPIQGPGFPFPFPPISVPTTSFTKSEQFLKTGFFSSGNQNNYFNQAQGSQFGGPRGGSSTHGTIFNGQQGITTNGIQTGNSGSFQGGQRHGVQGGSFGIGDQGRHLTFPQPLSTGQGGTYQTVKIESFSTNHGSVGGSQGVSQTVSQQNSQKGLQSWSAGGVFENSYGGAVLGSGKKPAQGVHANSASQQTQGSHGAAPGGKSNQGQATHPVGNTLTSGQNSLENILGSFGGSIDGSTGTGGLEDNQGQDGSTSNGQQNTIKVVQESFTGGAQSGNSVVSHSTKGQGGHGASTNAQHGNAQGSTLTQLQDSYGNVLSHDQSTHGKGNQLHTSQQGSDSSVNNVAHQGAPTDIAATEHTGSIYNGQSVYPSGLVPISPNGGTIETHEDQNQGTSANGIHGASSQQQGEHYGVQETTSRVVQEVPSFNTQVDSHGGNHGDHIDVAHVSTGSLNDAQTTRQQPVSTSHRIITNKQQGTNHVHNNAQNSVHENPIFIDQAQPNENPHGITTGVHQDASGTGIHGLIEVHAAPAIETQPQTYDDSRHGNQKEQQSVNGVHQIIQTGGHGSPSLNAQPQPANNPHYRGQGGTTQAPNSVQTGVHGGPAVPAQPQLHNELRSNNADHRINAATGGVQGLTPNHVNHGQGTSPFVSPSGASSAIQGGNPGVYESTATVVGESSPTVHDLASGQSGSGSVQDSLVTVVNESSAPNHQNTEKAFESGTVHESTATVVGEVSPSPGDTHGHVSGSQGVLTGNHASDSQKGLNTAQQYNDNFEHVQEIHAQDSSTAGTQDTVDNSGPSFSDYIRGASAPGLPANIPQGSFSTGHQVGTVNTVQESISAGDLSHRSQNVPANTDHKSHLAVDQGGSTHQLGHGTSQIYQETRGHQVNQPTNFQSNSDVLNKDVTYGATNGPVEHSLGAVGSQQEGASFKNTQGNFFNTAQQDSISGGVQLQTVPGVYLRPVAPANSQHATSNNAIKSGFEGSQQSTFNSGSQTSPSKQSQSSFSHSQGSSFGGSQNSFRTGVTGSTAGGLPGVNTIQQGSTITGGLSRSQGSSFLISQAGPDGASQTCQCTCQDVNNPILSRYTQGSQSAFKN
ncbi:hypothetical protein QAD02_000374 [Eretmocerus hayati]|uniref:Uncharacterized protein n=1 Tax=Eretmocerus hayati TaxID=131215 RepID=A0ACC2ND89_9HYME|nr:hypothetical protein QAD02_000374 [Eretmocerus hayati]